MANNNTPIDEALNRFLAAVPTACLQQETISLTETRGRILANDLSAAMDDPPYNRSIMEGYVVCVSDLAAASEASPVSLEVIGEIPVGQSTADGLVSGKVLQVTTGSFIPPGDFAVVRAWDVKRTEHQITVSKPVKANENIEAQGEMIKKGDDLFKQGHAIASSDIFTLASQGVLDLCVVRKPRIALFSSGDEVIPATEPFKVGAIWDCNRYGLSSLIEEAGGQPIFKGIMKDNLSDFTEKLKEGLEEADMAVISGGTAVGGADFTAALINAAGAPGTLVNGIPMRSGKPIVLGVADRKPIVCVAGHPPEAARGFGLFGLPAIAHLMGTTQK